MSIKEMISFKFALSILPTGIKSDSQHCIFKMKTGNIFSNLTFSDLIFSKHSIRLRLMLWGRTPQTMLNYTCEISASEYPLLFPEKDTTPVINAMMATLVLTSIGWFIYNFYLRKVNLNCNDWKSVEDFLNNSTTVMFLIFNILNLTSIVLMEILNIDWLHWLVNKMLSSSSNVTSIAWITLSILNSIFSSILVYGIRRRKAYLIKIYLQWANSLLIICWLAILFFSGLFAITLKMPWIVALTIPLINISTLLFVQYVGHVVILYTIILGERSVEASEMSVYVSSQPHQASPGAQIIPGTDQICQIIQQSLAFGTMAMAS